MTMKSPTLVVVISLEFCWDWGFIEITSWNVLRVVGDLHDDDLIGISRGI